MFGQAMAFHLSLWYTKRDLAKRVGLFISAGSLSGAFGGLIAFGVQHIKKSPIAQWRILFLIEGCPSVLLAICVALFMPSRPDRSRLLNEEQRTLCLTRLNAENSVDDRPGIDWKGVRRTMTDWKTYVVSVGYVGRQSAYDSVANFQSCLNLGLGSVGGFLPTIIKGLGYSNAKVGHRHTGTKSSRTGPTLHRTALRCRTCLHAPPHLLFRPQTNPRNPCRRSFHHRHSRMVYPPRCQRPQPIAKRTPHQILWLYLRGSGRLHQHSHHHLYVGFLSYHRRADILAWQSANTGNQSQRAASLGMLNTLGQCLSLAAAFL